MGDHSYNFVNITRVIFSWEQFQTNQSQVFKKTTTSKQIHQQVRKNITDK